MFLPPTREASASAAVSPPVANASRGTLTDVLIPLVVAIVYVAFLLACATQVFGFAVAAFLDWPFALLPGPSLGTTRDVLKVVCAIAGLPIVLGVFVAFGAVVRAPLIRRLPSTLTDQRPLPWRMVWRVVVGDQKRTSESLTPGLAPRFWLGLAAWSFAGAGAAILEGRQDRLPLLILASSLLTAFGALCLYLAFYFAGNWLVALLSLEEPVRGGESRKPMHRFISSRESFATLRQTIGVTGMLVVVALLAVTLVAVADHADWMRLWLMIAWVVALLAFVWLSMRQMPAAHEHWNRQRGTLPWTASLGSPRMVNEPDREPTRTGLRFSPGNTSTRWFWLSFVAWPIVLAVGCWLAVCLIWLSPEPLDDAWFCSQRDRLGMPQFDRGELPGSYRVSSDGYTNAWSKLSSAVEQAVADGTVPTVKSMTRIVAADPSRLVAIGDDAREWLDAHPELRELAAAQGSDGADFEFLPPWVAIRLAATVGRPLTAPDGLVAALREVCRFTRMGTDTWWVSRWEANHLAVSEFVDCIDTRLSFGTDLAMAGPDELAALDQVLQELDEAFCPYVETAIRQNVFIWQLVPTVRWDPIFTMALPGSGYEWTMRYEQQLRTDAVWMERERHLNRQISTAPVADPKISAEREIRMRMRLFRVALRLGVWQRDHELAVGSLVHTLDPAALALTGRPTLGPDALSPGGQSIVVGSRSPIPYTGGPLTLDCGQSSVGIPQ